MIIYGALYIIPFIFGMFGLSGLFGWFTSVYLEHIASNLMIASALGGAYLLFQVAAFQGWKENGNRA